MCYTETLCLFIVFATTFGLRINMGLLLKEELSRSKFFPLIEVPTLKRDAMDTNHCSSKKSSFDVRNSFNVRLGVNYFEKVINYLQLHWKLIN